jgi:hypothetical protein
MEQTKSEIAEALQQAHRDGNQEEILRLEQELFTQTSGALEQLRATVDTKKQDVQQLEGKTDRKTNGERRRLYKEFIALYRSAKALTEEISDIKKQMRGEQDETYQNNLPGAGSVREE